MMRHLMDWLRDHFGRHRLPFVDDRVRVASDRLDIETTTLRSVVKHRVGGAHNFERLVRDMRGGH